MLNLNGGVLFNVFDFSHYIQKTANIFLFILNLQTFDNYAIAIWD